MSSHTRVLDATGRLADELVVDIIFLMRRKSWHWIAVVIGLVLGAAIGAAAGIALGRGLWFFTFSAAGVLAGLGMNVGSDFRFIAITTSRLLLVDSSRIIAHPVRSVRQVRPDAITSTTKGLIMRVTIEGEGGYVTSRQNHDRLQRMLHFT